MGHWVRGVPSRLPRCTRNDNLGEGFQEVPIGRQRVLELGIACQGGRRGKLAVSGCCAGKFSSGSLHFWVGEIGILKIGGEKLLAAGYSYSHPSNGFGNEFWVWWLRVFYFEVLRRVDCPDVRGALEFRPLRSPVLEFRPHSRLTSFVISPSRRNL
jgi:hypothetical protein